MLHVAGLIELLTKAEESGPSRNAAEFGWIGLGSIGCTRALAIFWPDAFVHDDAV